MIMFDGGVSQIGGYHHGVESRLRRPIDTDKMIQYEEMISKGSERPASMFAPNDGRHTAQGLTSNSVMMSGTPTDASNYYNRQTFY